MMQQRPCVLVLAGHDPCGGAGIQADIEAISAQGAHALPVITALTVQDNERVYAVHPVETSVLEAQIRVLLARFTIAAVKTGIVASARHALLLAGIIAELKRSQPDLPVIVDPVLGSGKGDRLSVEDAVTALQPLLQSATLITPNLPELARLSGFADADRQQQLQSWMPGHSAGVLVKGGHSDEAMVRNCWYAPGQWQSRREWLWERLPGEFHGSGCTLAAAIAAQLALGRRIETALELAQAYTQHSLQEAYVIAAGQKIPGRIKVSE